MTITAYAQWDGTTAANNVDLNDIPLVENQTFPRHVNNAFREMMKQLKAENFASGSFQPLDADLTDLASRWTTASASGPASLDIREDSDNGTHRVRLTVPASVTADRAWTFPDADVTVSSFIATVLDDTTAVAAQATLGVVGKQSFWISAGAMVPRASSGCGEATYDSGASDVTIRTCDFDTTSQEYAHFEFGMPKGWDEGTVTFTPYWTNTGGASTETVVFSLAGRALSNDDAINGAFGTVQTSTDTWLAQNDLHIGPESSAITIGGTPVEGDLVVFEVSRVVGSDNMAGDARLIGLLLHIVTNAANDA